MKNGKDYLLAIILIDLLFLLYGIDSLSISYKEVTILYEGKEFLHYLVQLTTHLFGESDYALRLPFVITHILSVVLLYLVSGFYLSKEMDRIISVAVFVMLPGVVSSALLVNSASLVIFFTLLFLYLFLNKKEALYSLLLPLLVFVDNSFYILYLSIFAYSIYKKDRYLSLLSAMMFLISLYMYGAGIHGKPRGYFLDILGAYSLILSPLVFLYFVFVLYRVLVREEKSILWFIAFTAFVTSLLLSFRQRVAIEDFAPFVVVSVPLMVRQFFMSLRVRLPELRTFHRTLFGLVMIFLVLNFIATYFNKYFYLFLDNPKRHFAYKYHIAKELAEVLKERDIEAISTNDIKLQKRLKFYHIGYDKSLVLTEVRSDNLQKSVTISYINKPIISYSVTKVNK